MRALFAAACFLNYEIGNTGWSGKPVRSSAFIR